MAAFNDSMLKPVEELTPITFTAGASVSSVAMPDGQGRAEIIIQIMATVNAHISLPSKTPVATNTQSMPIPAWVPMVFKIAPKDLFAVIGNTGGGILYITRME